MKATDCAVSIKGGKKYTFGYRHPFFGNFVIKLDSGEAFDDFESLEDAAIQLNKMSDIICIDCETDNVMIVNKKILCESVFIIKEYIEEE